MNNLAIHPVRRSDGPHYWLGDYPLYLRRAREGWRACTPVSCEPVSEWLRDTGLAYQYFASRQESLGVLKLALSCPSAPAADKPPRLKRLVGNRYSFEDRFLIVRRKGFWTVTEPGQSLCAMVSGSLWCASWVALYHYLRVCQPVFTIRPLVGFTNGEISRQRNVMEGTDRPSWANNMMGFGEALEGREALKD